MQNFRALGDLPPDPRASGGWGLCPQTPWLAPPIANLWLRAWCCSLKNVNYWSSDRAAATETEYLRLIPGRIKSNTAKYSFSPWHSAKRSKQCETSTECGRQVGRRQLTSRPKGFFVVSWPRLLGESRCTWPYNGTICSLEEHFEPEWMKAKIKSKCVKFQTLLMLWVILLSTNLLLPHLIKQEIFDFFQNWLAQRTVTKFYLNEIWTFNQIQQQIRASLT